MKNIVFRPAMVIMFFLSNMLVCLAQGENIQADVFEKIRKAEFETSQIPGIAHYLTDVSGPRLTNSPGFTRSAEWAMQALKSWGLTRVKMEPWGEFGRSWELQEFSVAMKKPYFQPIEALPAQWSGNTKGLQQAQVMLLSQAQFMDSIYIKSHYRDLKGKIILVSVQPTDESADIFSPAATRETDSSLLKLKAYLTDAERSKPDNYYSSAYNRIHAVNDQFRIMEKLDLLYAKAGIIAVITSEGESAHGTLFVECPLAYQSKANLPKVKMAVEDCRRITRLVTSGHPVELALNIKGNYSGTDTKGYNVVGEIAGTDPKLKDQVVIIGAHLDSYTAATGATDNAAGCAVMMEAVRLLDSLHLQPKRTIRIALWSGEEEALLGSYNYVKNHYINPSTGLPNAEQEKVSAYFNLDNGTGKIRGIFTEGNTAIKPVFEKWFEPFHDLGAATVTTKHTGYTDHTSFDWAGIPGFQFIQDPIDYERRTHHSNQDNYDHLQIEDLKQAAVIIASFVYQSGNRPDLLPRKPFEKRKFEWDGVGL